MTESISTQDYIDMGLSAFHRNDIDKATEYFDQALTLDPNAYQAMNYRGIIALHLDDEEKAVEWWKMSIDCKENFEAFSNLGFYYSKADRLSEAKPFLIKAYELNAASTDAAIQWAFIEMTDGNFKDAEEILEPLLENEFAFEQSYLMLSQVKLEQKQYDQAIALLEKLIERVPDSTEGLHKLAKIHWFTENHKTADQYYESLRSILPEHLDILKEHGVLLRDHIDVHKGIAVLEKALNLTTMDWELHLTLAIGYEKANHSEKALESFIQATNLNPNEQYLKQKVVELKEKLAKQQSS